LLTFAAGTGYVFGGFSFSEIRESGVYCPDIQANPMKIFFIIIIISSGVAIISYSSSVGKNESPFTWEESTIVENPVVVAIPEISDEPVIPEEEITLPESATHIVLFTSQAPSAQWFNPVFQNACEEASIVMATAWAKNEETLLGKTIVEQNIQSISADAEKRFGKNTYDASAEDTATLFREYSGLETSVRHDVTFDDITDAIRKGNIVIAPFDGRKLGNRNYTPPGPVYHMLVIIGYDAEAKEFITNDPGTRYGASYRYNEDILFEAIRDYQTGYHLPTTSVPEKTIIIVSRHITA
jgi:hypothetical protein